MNRGDAYKVLSAQLNELRASGYEALLLRVGQPPTSGSLQLNGGPVVIDVEVSWADHKRRNLRVCATASGPSTWRMERLDESFIIAPPEAERAKKPHEP